MTQIILVYINCTIIIIYIIILFYCHTERIRQLNKIEIDWEEKRKSLNEEMMRVETLLTSAYDRYINRLIYNYELVACLNSPFITS